MKNSITIKFNQQNSASKEQYYKYVSILETAIEIKEFLRSRTDSENHRFIENLVYHTNEKITSLKKDLSNLIMAEFEYQHLR